MGNKNALLWLYSACCQPSHLLLAPLLHAQKTDARPLIGLKLTSDT
jgi:hypothetical protein